VLKLYAAVVLLLSHKNRQLLLLAETRLLSSGGPFATQANWTLTSLELGVALVFYRELVTRFAGRMKTNTSAHPIGHVIRNLLAREEACILRVIHPENNAFEHPEDSDLFAYLVAVPARRMAAARESVWLHSNVEPISQSATAIEFDDVVLGAIYISLLSSESQQPHFS
jgi:hypothetical protein